MDESLSLPFNPARFRYSTRALLVLMTCVAAFLYWRSRPALIAQRFVSAVENGQFRAADELFINPEHKFVAELMKPRDGFGGVQAPPARQTLKQWICGVCELTLYSGKYGYSMRVTARGLHEPERFELIGGGSFGGF
ncbi:MAG TPA: hypothetical protein VJ828_03700 [Lacipirellulaceae bacterium]|jgi:hypothetical protein|nr:hypothetical protein [Lacipirellulaceae bacterium]